jgi:predicted dehydrogenase
MLMATAVGLALHQRLRLRQHIGQQQIVVAWQGVAGFLDRHKFHWDRVGSLVQHLEISVLPIGARLTPGHGRCAKRKRFAIGVNPLAVALHLQLLQVRGQAALDGIITAPRFIESHRLAPFKARGTDVSVVLDLMIHDIDLIQSIVRSPLEAIDAVGSRVFSDDLDIANARLRFRSGCVANVTASRVSLKTERKIRVFQDDAYVSADLQQKILTMIRRGAPGGDSDPPQVSIDERSYEQGDALKAEIEAFLHSARTGAAPLVGGAEGLAALHTATRIAALVAEGARRGG